MKNFLNILGKYAQRKKPDDESIRVEISGFKYEDLGLENIQKKVEDNYFPKLKGKVDIVYIPDTFVIEISTNSNIFGYKPTIKIGPNGAFKLIGTSESVKEGVLAHEYSHIEDINKKGLIGIIKRAYRKRFYIKTDDFDKKLRYEIETDLNTAKKGCGKQMLEALEELKRQHIEGEEPLQSTEFALKQLNPRIESIKNYLESNK